MEPEKHKRIEDEFIIIDEQEELRRAHLELHRMTHSHRQGLKSKLKATIGDGLIVPVVSVATMVFFQTVASDLNGATLAIGWLAAVGMSLVFGGIGVMRWKQISDDLRNGRVEFVEGVITLDVLSGGRGGPTYRLHVGSEVFTISKEMYSSLDNHQPYRVYYAPHSRLVLETEPFDRKPK